MHECLSTIINMVLSVQVYYYSDINIANFKRYFLHVLNTFLLFILDYFHLQLIDRSTGYVRVISSRVMPTNKGCFISIYNIEISSTN